MRTCKWGVSNVSPAMLEEILRLCEERGLQKPTCYQGEYNLATRGMEVELLPLLRKHKMKFNAFRCVFLLDFCLPITLPNAINRYRFSAELLNY